MLSLPSRFALAATAVALSLSTAAVAQVVSTPGRLIGFTSGGTTLTTTIQRQQLCNPSQRVCPSLLPAPTVPYAGGAAYDARNRSLWHTEGNRIYQTLIDTCQTICQTPAALGLGPNSVASGLAMSEARNILYQLETIPGQAAIHLRHARSCPLNVLQRCRFSLPTLAHTAGAVTIDEENGLIFYAASITGPTPGPSVFSNQILVARLSDPCNLLCRFPARACGPNVLGPITAMAYDACSDFLHISDGRQTVIYGRSGTMLCDWSEVRCCAPSPSAQNWHGFDIEPTPARQVGRSCSGPNCIQCPNLELTTVGDAVVGNPAFGLSIQGGPNGGLGLISIAPGPCQVPGIPALCGRWHLSSVSFFPSQTLTGTSPCDGSMTSPLPLPALYALCGISLCAQGLVICPNVTGGPTGFALTNALQIAISD